MFVRLVPSIPLAHVTHVPLEGLPAAGIELTCDSARFLAIAGFVGVNGNSVMTNEPAAISDADFVNFMDFILRTFFVNS
jgi:hypothetical protein